MALPKIREQIEARVKDTGDTMTDNLIIKRDTYPGVALDVLGTGTRTSLQGWDNSAVLVNFNISGDTDNRRAIFIKNSNTTTQIKNALTLKDWVDGTSTEYKLYGEHNKPTPADIGAATASHVHDQYYTSDINRTANTVLAAPNGSAGSASFRKLVATDIPDLSGTYLKLSGGTMTGPINMKVGTGLSMSHESGKDTPWIYPKGATGYGIRYLEGTPDKMMISASGNNTTAGGADLCINGNGEGTVTIRGNTILHAGNYNSYSPTKTGGGASGTWPISISGSAGSVSWGNVSGKPDFSRAPILYTINLSSYSTSNFYFVDFGTSNLELDCEIHSRGAGQADPWNQNVLHFLMVGQGWSDTPKNLTILNQSFYDGSEKTIMSIVHGNQNGVRGVYLRGGLTYTIRSNFAPNLNTTTKTWGNESYASGTTSYTTITNATTLWTNDGVSKSIFSMPVNAVMLSNTDYTTYRGRSIAANTSPLTSGSSSLSDGYIYVQYE